MFTRIYLSFMLFAAIPVWSQVTTTMIDAAATPENETLMQTPPPISGEAYPTVIGSVVRSPKLSACTGF